MITQKVSRFVIRNSALIFAALILLSGVLGYSAISKLSIKVVLEEMLPVSKHNVQIIQKYGSQFGGANTTLISVTNKNGDIYNSEFLNDYMKFSDDIYFYEGAKRHLVQSLSLRKTKAITGSAGRIQIEALMWPNAPSNEEQMETFRKAVREQYRGLFVADDEKSAIIIADFEDNINYESLVTFLNDRKVELAEKGIEVAYSGRPILLGNIYKSLDHTVFILFVSVALISAILWLYFKSLIGVCVPLFVTASATLWGLGFMGLRSYNLDPLLILLPAFIFAIVMSHNVQFMTRIFDAYSKGVPKNDAIESSLSKILFPSIGAISTDAAGFTVLVLVGIPSIKALALICTIWLLAIVPSIVFTAVTLKYLPVPSNTTTGLNFVYRFWGHLNIDKKYHVFVSGALIALVLGILGSNNLTIGDAKGSPIFWPEHDFNRDSNSINTKFSFVGTDPMQVFVNGGENTMLNPDTYYAIEDMDRYVYQHVMETRPAQSLVPIIKKVNSVLYEGDPSYELIPNTNEEIGFNIYLFRSRGEPGDFAAYTDPEWKIGNITFPVKDHAADTVDASINTVRSYISNSDFQDTVKDFEYTGGQIGLTKAINEEIKESNYKVLLSITLVILLCVTVLYRSLKISFIVVLCLAISNFLTYAFMAYKGIGLSINTLPLAALGIGMGVDFSIYILDRIKEEISFGLNPYDAMREAVHTSGNAIFVTAITMIIPLLPWFFFSELKFQAEMGLLLGLVLFLNMVGALILVPAFVMEFKPALFFKKEENLDNNNVVTA